MVTRNQGTRRINNYCYTKSSRNRLCVTRAAGGSNSGFEKAMCQCRRRVQKSGVEPEALGRSKGQNGKETCLLACLLLFARFKGRGV